MLALAALALLHNPPHFLATFLFVPIIKVAETSYGKEDTLKI